MSKKKTFTFPFRWSEVTTKLRNHGESKSCKLEHHLLGNKQKHDRVLQLPTLVWMSRYRDFKRL